MAKKGKSKSAKLEIEENESGPSDSKPSTALVSSDDEEANEDLSLKIIEKSLLVKAAPRFDESNHGVVSVVDLRSSSSRRGQSDVAGTSGGGGEEAVDLDLKSKKSVKKKKKKTKIEKAPITEEKDTAKMIEKVETIEEDIMVKPAETVESVMVKPVETVESVMVKPVETVESVIVKPAEMVESVIVKPAETVEPVESPDPNTVDKSVNVVLRKLLRGARYFDLPESGWETCYNCGEEGHMAVNCTSATKRKKPCFLCGSLEHNARQCSKAQDCFICKKGGHRAKDCPDKHNSALKNARICLRCGGTGHDMFSCRNDYSQDDLKKIQCYVCKSFGHLCCVNAVDTNASEVSCYRCGQLGHTGLSCGRSYGEMKETIDNGSPSLCYKCGEGGHFARECTTGTPSSSLCYKCGGEGHFARECSSATAGKRNREPSTPNARPRRENREFSGYKSTPNDHGKTHKRTKIKFEENGYITPRKEKQRGGWITEDSGDYSNRKSARSHWNEDSGDYSNKKSAWSWNEDSGDYSNRKSARSHWNSPSTPYTEGRRISGSHSSKQKNSNRYSASRFSNFGNDEQRKVYNW